MARTKPTSSGRGALPAELTSFVGRRRELAETRRLFASSRLLTLTGVGGVGKTRLAVRMAAEVRRTFPDGVWFVELAALHDPQLLAQAVANALDLRQVSANPSADLASYLEPQRLLVVLDNCEHLTDACAMLVSKLLAAAPGLRVLATSRHVLGIEGEQILLVPPLSVPDADREVLAGDATHFESVALFLDRATAVAPGFEIEDQNRTAVVELCRRLDGVPLAIELTAVWLRILSPAQILDGSRTGSDYSPAADAPHPPGQRALDATVGWSFDLCSPREQLMWARLSVFSGGFDLEAAEEVCSGDEIAREDVLNLVAGLVNKSIIVRKPTTEHTPAWYQMLETIRQYGAERLAELDQTQPLRLRHRDHYRALATRFAAESFSSAQADWFVRLRREHDNVRAALESCLADTEQAPVALDIAAPMWNFWFAGFLREGHRYLVRALALATERRPAGQPPSGPRAIWPCSPASSSRPGGCWRTPRSSPSGSTTICCAPRECSGHALMYQGDLPAAVALLEQGLTAFRAAGDPLGEFDTLVLLAAAMFFLEDPRDAEFAVQALTLADHHGALSSKAYALWSIGVSQWRSDEHEQATASLRRCVRLFQPMHDLTGLSFGAQALSWCATSVSLDERAARLLGASQAVWRASGAKVDETSAYTMIDHRCQTAVREAVGAAEFEQAFADGASYSLEQAVSLALGQENGTQTSDQPGSARFGPGAPGGLTRRELEIAQLLAEGLSNKGIAARLVISQRTVETHVDRILSKLGFVSRHQVASWVAEQQSR